MISQQQDRTSQNLSQMLLPSTMILRKALQVNPKYVDKNIYETLDRLNSYELHQKKLDSFKRQLHLAKNGGIPADPRYLELKKSVMANKIRTHEYIESKKISEIKRNNQKLLGKLLEISKGKQSQTAQKNMKLPRGASKSLNYVSKKREAERIDRENQKILGRILNVKCNRVVDYDRLTKDYRHVHLKNKKMILDKNQGVYVEDLIENRQRYKDAYKDNLYSDTKSKQPTLPKINSSDGSNTRGLYRFSNPGRKLPTASTNLGFQSNKNASYDG